MPRCIDQVQDVDLPVVCLVCQPNRVRLDSDPSLALEIHAVEHLSFHLTCLERSRHLEKPIGQSRLAVVDVGDDGEIADETLVHWARKLRL